MMQRRVFMLIQVAVTLLLTFYEPTNAAKIAVFNNFFTHSHSAFLSSLADVLSEHGHDVTVVTAEVDTTINFPTPKKATHMVQKYTNHTTFQNPEFIRIAQENLWSQNYDFAQKQRTIGLFRKRIEDQCERLLTNKKFVAKVTAEKFDFALTEPMDYCGYGFMKLAGIPAYANSIPMAMAGVVARALGLDGPLFEPFPIASGSNTEMSFMERVRDKVTPFYTVMLDGMDIRELSVPVVRKVVDPAFTATEAIANGRYLFFNTEEHMDFPRPISHKVVYIGGVTVSQSSADNLPDDYKDIFNNAKHGVVYVSFGSIARSSYMPEHIKAAFLATFRAFPEISFIWKYEDPTDDVAKDLPNVFKKAWVPQKEVLAHPRLLAFVTHGGMNSVLEAAFAGVPLLGVPLFADQYRNVKMLEFRGTSVVVKKADIKAAKLIEAIHTLTDTDDHRIRAREIASLARTKPLNATQRFISYINHAIAFSNTTDFLDINNRKMSTLKFYDLDVYAFLVGIAALIVGVVVYSVFKIVEFLLGVCIRSVSVDQKKTL